MPILYALRWMRLERVVQSPKSSQNRSTDALVTLSLPLSSHPAARTVNSLEPLFILGRIILWLSHRSGHVSTQASFSSMCISFLSFTVSSTLTLLYRSCSYLVDASIVPDYKQIVLVWKVSQDKQPNCCLAAVSDGVENWGQTLTMCLSAIQALSTNLTSSLSSQFCPVEQLHRP